VNCFACSDCFTYFFLHSISIMGSTTACIILYYSVTTFWQQKIIILLNLRFFSCWVSAGPEICCAFNFRISLSFPVWLCHDCPCMHIVSYSLLLLCFNPDSMRGTK
jgi:hypothetical protein